MITELSLRLRVCWAVLLSLISTASFASAASDLSVTGLNLLGKQRVGRTEFEYTYSVDIRNSGSVGYRNVVGTVTSNKPATAELYDPLSDNGSNIVFWVRFTDNTDAIVRYR